MKVLTPEEISELQCTAFECPNRWSVDTGRKLCSAHAWSEPHEWAKITQGLYSAAIVKIKRHKDPIKALTKQEKKEAIQRIQNLPLVDSKKWAYKLKDREESGEHLSQLQKKIWRVALRIV
jgi:hypothetical protein